MAEVLVGVSRDHVFSHVVPSKMVPIQVAQAPDDEARRSNVSRYGTIQASASSVQPPPQAYGLGTRTNPYDLRTGLKLELTCLTECGYPEAALEWHVNNAVSS